MIYTNVPRDLSERNHQVQLMGRIYQGAEKVVVWLGAGSYSVAQGIPYLESLASRGVDRSSLWTLEERARQDSSSSSDEDAVAYRRAQRSAWSIAESQWFRRTWVVQELCWARNVVFAIGEADMSFRAVMLSFSITQFSGDVGNRVEAAAKNKDWLGSTGVDAMLMQTLHPHIKYGTYLVHSISRYNTKMCVVSNYKLSLCGVHIARLITRNYC